MKKLEYQIFNNKKAGEKLFSIWWFFVLAVVGVGIVAGVYIFYSADVDVREAEAGILYEKIADCIIEQGFLTDKFLYDKENFDIYKGCDLNKKIIEGDYYIKIQAFDESNNEFISIIKGNPSFSKDCDIILSNDKLKAEKYPKCIRKAEGVLYYDNNEIKKAKIEILTASNQQGETSAV